MISSLTRLVVLVSGALGTLGMVALADEAHRSNWVPNVGELGAEEEPLGDLWTFRCPQGGSVRATVDTKDDTDDGGSDIDPALVILDGQGNVVGFGDDEEACTYAPVCGFRCPSVQAECGERGRHSIVVRDFGAAAGPGPACRGGGGYELSIEVVASNGQPLSEQQMKFGGGPRKVPSLPAWLRDAGAAPIGPALDDEDVPKAVESDKETCVILGPGTGTCETSATAVR